MKAPTQNTRTLMINVFFGLVVLVNIISPLSGVTCPIFLKGLLTLLFSFAIFICERKVFFSNLLIVNFLCAILIVVQLSLHTNYLIFVELTCYFLIGNSIARGSIKTYTTKFLLIQLFGVLFVRIFVFNVDPHNLVEYSSRNIVSVYAVGLTTVHYLAYYINNSKSKISVWPAVGTFFFSFLSLGRSGIFSSGLLFLIVASVRISQPKLKISNGFIGVRLITIIVLTSIMVVTFFICKDPIVDLANHVGNFTNFRKGLESKRFDLWINFFKEYDLKYLLTGYDLSSHWQISQYRSNPHNAYLNFLAQGGIGCIIFLLFLTLSIFKLISKKRYFVICLLVPVMIRGMTDIAGLLVGFFDIILFTIIVYASRVLPESLNFDGA